MRGLTKYFSRLKSLAWLSVCAELAMASILIGVCLAAKTPEFTDPHSTLNQSGIKTPREFFLPQTPSYDKVDPGEFFDYKKTYETPYAQITIFKTLQSGETKIPPGYYVVKKTPTLLIIKRAGEMLLAIPILKADRDRHTSRKKITSARLLLESEGVLNPLVVRMEYCDVSGCYQTGPVTPGLVE